MTANLTLISSLFDPSLSFLIKEHPSPQLAAAGCHLIMLIPAPLPLFQSRWHMPTETMNQSVSLLTSLFRAMWWCQDQVILPLHKCSRQGCLDQDIDQQGSVFFFLLVMHNQVVLCGKTQECMQTSKEETWVRVVEAYLDFVSMKQSGLLLNIV